MKGTVLDYNEAEGKGMISGDDGNRYPFSGSDVDGGGRIVRGVKVDFDVKDGVATAIYRDVGGIEAMTADKNKWVAGLLALFLGGLGIHKFYLGRKKQGIIMLVCLLVGFIFSWTVIGAIPAIVVSIIAFIEAIIYFIRSEDEFQRLYVEGAKAWF